MAEPMGEVDARYSNEGAVATPWAEARARLAEAEIYWLTTVRPEGRPHVTPLIAVWLDDALWFTTGPEERKARNLAANAHCVLTTGDNALREGLDLVVEGEAGRVSDDATLRRVADVFETKYSSEWHFEIRDGLAHHGAGTALAYRVPPSVVFAFRKGDYAQTRYRF
jgi:nitroimidazol reductase NimA-like FMN-containing flavoprotein (pyridoxamine 5'-phosphate oxidase superfamily)